MFPSQGHGIRSQPKRRDGRGPWSESPAEAEGGGHTGPLSMSDSLPLFLTPSVHPAGVTERGSWKAEVRPMGTC